MDQESSLIQFPTEMGAVHLVVIKKYKVQTHTKG